MEHKTKSDTITLSKSDMWRYATFILAAALIIGAIIYFSSNDETTTVVDGKPVTVEVGSSPVKGSDSAKITLVEFSDYECPFCGRHFLQTYPQIVKNYIDTGKVKIVFKDFPLSFHPEAQKAAEAARAVGSQLGEEGYWKMHDKLFSNQQSLSVENYKKWARELGADGDEFDDDLDSGKFAGDVNNDLEQGKKLGISGTPAFIVNGKKIVGACPYSTFQAAFDAELAGKDWQVTNCQTTVN